LLKNKIYYIVHQFLPKDDIIWVKKLESGIINQTFLIRVKAEPCKEYILQQINHSVFQNVPDLMTNLKIITEQLNKRVVKNNDLLPFQTFIYYPAINGLNYYLHSDNTYWRLSDYVQNSSDIDKKNPLTVNEAGKLFGYFINLLTDVDLFKIKEIIPGFHDSEKYYRDFLFSVEKDVHGRLSETKTIYKKFINYSYLIDEFAKLKNDKTIPLRLVHNDTKIDNILFNEKEQAISVIDLDTCMPGYLMTDFGDAIRSLSNTGAEDEPDLNNVTFDFSLYQSFAQGFLSSVQSFILPEEKNNLAFFALLITYEQALRFYTDYLNGDTYYHTEYKTHNLQRTKVQLKLLDEMREWYKEMKAFVKD
jgi:serine/threonine protein kinase